MFEIDGVPAIFRPSVCRFYSSFSEEIFTEIPCSQEPSLGETTRSTFTVVLNVGQLYFSKKNFVRFLINILLYECLVRVHLEILETLQYVQTTLYSSIQLFHALDNIVLLVVGW